MNMLQVKANGKINLALAVKFKREDGYHELELIYQEIDFYDRIHLEKNTDFVFTTDNPIPGPVEENLCMKAARILQKEVRLGGLKIHLEKQIPVGGGLGGGSSDAAAVLKGGLQLYERKVPEKKLLQLAASLGSDVPFFLKGKTAYGRGRGELIKPIRLFSDYHILLIIPPFKISTAWAYKNLNLALTSKYTDYKFRGFRFQNLGLVEFRSEFFNDFEKSVFNTYPALASIKSQLYENGAQYAAMSGSGAVMFGLFDSDKRLGMAHEAMRGQYDCRIARPVQGDSQK